MLLFRKWTSKNQFSLKSQIKQVLMVLLLARIVYSVINVAHELKRVAHLCSKVTNWDFKKQLYFFVITVYNLKMLSA